MFEFCDNIRAYEPDGASDAENKETTVPLNLSGTSECVSGAVNKRAPKNDDWIVHHAWEFSGVRYSVYIIYCLRRHRVSIYIAQLKSSRSSSSALLVCGPWNIQLDRCDLRMFRISYRCNIYIYMSQ